MAIIRGTADTPILRGTADADQIHLYKSGKPGTGGQIDGGDGDDEIYGGDGNDTLVGGKGNDTIIAGGPGTKIDGGEGDDILIGSAGDDVIVTGSGNNRIDSGEGYDVIYGGDGNDLYVVRSRDVVIHDTGGRNAGMVMVDFYKTPTAVQSWAWESGVKKLPYWLDNVIDPNVGAAVRLLAAGHTMYYAFPTAAPAQLSDGERRTFQPFTDEQKAAAVKALAYISTVVDIRFVETKDATALNTIVFGNSAQPPDRSANAHYPSDEPIGSDLMLAIGKEGATIKDGERGALLLMHELGHSLGLKHSYPGAEIGPFFTTAEASTQWSLMNGGYFERPEDYHLGLAPIDIAALQYLYGPSKQGAGDSVLKLDTAGPNFLWDGGGTDTVDGSGLTQALTLSLEQGSWGYVGQKAPLITAPGQITVNIGSVLENAIGGSGNDDLSGNALANRLDGGAGDDRLTGGAGNDTLVGGDGIDTAAFTGTRADFTVRGANGTFTVIDNKNGLGTDTLTGVERIRFNDGAVALDIDGNGGQVYRLYQAAFDRVPDKAGLGYWIAALDSGASLHGIAEGFVKSAEFASVFGAQPSNATLVEKLYEHVLHRAPDEGGRAYWLDILDNNRAGAADLLVGFSESVENKAALIGVLQGGGAAYTPWLG